MDIGTIIAIAGMVLGWAFTIGKLITQHNGMRTELDRLDSTVEKRISEVDDKMVRNLEKIYGKLECNLAPCRMAGGCPNRTEMSSKLDKLDDRLHKLHRSVILVSKSVRGSSSRGKETTKS